MGGTLVTRNQISVDHRFAGRRRWSEATIAPGDDGLLVGATSTELGVDQMKLLRVDGKRIVLARTSTGYVAFDDACSHEGGSLAGGTMICGTVQCPWHGSQFDTRTGCVRAGPAERGIGVYAVEECNGVVRISPNARQ
jgi:nitrite reductase/ring-hydroxylating ferredoxin subunit